MRAAVFILLAVAVAEAAPEEVVARAVFLLEPAYQRLTPEVEAALQALLAAQPEEPARILSLGQAAVEQARTAGYL